VSDLRDLKHRMDVAVDSLLALKRDAMYGGAADLVGACDWTVKVILEARAKLPDPEPESPCEPRTLWSIPSPG
jgi:hypothetical protein